MPEEFKLPHERQCSACHGEGTIEVCTGCDESVDECRCDGDTIPEIDSETCEQCEGSGDAQPDDEGEE